MICGGAPLSPESHEFIRSCMGCPLLQGYSLTETSGCATGMTLDENSTGRVGPPIHGVIIRLENWEEGNYRVTDKLPRGEILIGGGHIAAGYYKQPDQTVEAFCIDNNGMRWFRSGDIGQMEEDGTLKIIDRKKDLVKLQSGEYVSLGKVESVLKCCSLVDNICIYADPTTSYVVALLCPERSNLAKVAEKLGDKEANSSALFADKDLTLAVLREIVQYGKQFRLENFETPGALTLCEETWTPESGLMTASFKLKRKPLQQFYQTKINCMYGIPSGACAISDMDS